MRKNQTSITALGIATLRALETEKPENERICFDPYARRFLPGWFYHMLRYFIQTGIAERRGRGVIGFITARERYIDDYLLGCLQQGFEQLVILGAGFDSRAYRFEALKDPIRVFEVDHPATQQAKLQRLKKILGSLPAHVRYVPIDFNTQTLEDSLISSGYDSEGKTVFLWQGVTYYLEPTAVDQTLDFIARCSAPGSRVIFDYIDNDLLAMPTEHHEVRRMIRYRGMTGEGLRFGIPIVDIETYLDLRGFGQVVNIRSEDLKALYFHGKNTSRNVMSGYAIVSAIVKQVSSVPKS